jgi:hypothetical protein
MAPLALPPGAGRSLWRWTGDLALCDSMAQAGLKPYLEGIGNATRNLYLTRKLSGKMRREIRFVSSGRGHNNTFASIGRSTGSRDRCTGFSLWRMRARFPLHLLDFPLQVCRRVGICQKQKSRRGGTPRGIRPRRLTVQQVKRLRLFLCVKCTMRNQDSIADFICF